ncbi:MAG: hypothetical protein JWQ03_590 [Variovorax sp.]|nr:hypothetical protein [Variovorax sp.]
MKLTLGVFAGAARALHPKLLADTVGVQSLNQKPGRGDFQPWRQPLAVATVPATRQTIYRMGRDVKSDANYWLTWSTRVHAVRGFDSQDTTERTYYTGDGFPKWTDNTMALGAGPMPVAWRQLGVPAPVSAPILAASGGVSTSTESRYVVYTFVTDKGEESAQSAISLECVCKKDATLAISNIEAPPSGSFVINRVRIYVTVSGDRGDTEFFFLREIAAGVTSTTDDLRARGRVLETANWLMPPADLKHLTGLWAGMLAGVSAGAFRFCVPEVPYAWPIANEILPPDAFALAIGTWGQKMLGLTTGRPLLITGSSPDSMDSLPIEGQACVAPAAAVSFGHGVAWPGEDGLSYIGDAGAKLLTDGLLTRDDWQAMHPATMVAGEYEGAYLCFYTEGEGGAAVRRGFLLDPLNPAGIFFLDKGYDACWFDKLQDCLYVLDGTDVKKWDAGTALMTAVFRSKEFVTGYVNFAWAKVTADSYPVTLKIDAGPFTSDQIDALVAYRPDVLSKPGGDKVRATLTATGEDAFPLPAGFTAPECQLQVETTGAVQAVVLATSVGETV